VEVGPENRSWWEAELSQQAKAGIDTALSPPAQDPFALGSTRARKVRALLGLPLPEPPPADAVLLRVSSGSARKARWARIRAAQDAHIRVAVFDSTTPAQGQALDAAIEPADLLKTPPPRCPGAFGGTTILVLASGIAPAELAAWEDLEKNDPLAKASRFHRLRIATTGGEHELDKVLGELAAAKRTNVLIIPAQFCASPGEMRALRARVRAFADSMTIHWLPGLGGPS